MKKQMLALLFFAPIAMLAQKPEYTSSGDLLMPKNFREWMYLTSGVGMTYDANAAANPNPPFENVFVNPSAYRAFLKTGAWPDKTILILEIRKSETKVSINKNGHVQTDAIGTEVHVKDASKGGWLFYAIPRGEAKGSLIAKTMDCYTCHQQNGATDTTFVQFYPTLIDIAKQHGNFKETAHQ